MKRPLLSLMASMAILAACTGGGGEAERPAPSPSPEPWRGGTLHLLSALWPVSIIEPREWGYGGLHWELYRCCLLRTLFSYEAVPAAEGGTIARPDLASGDPEVSADGLRWTIRLRQGLRYAPPFEDTEIVAGDFVRALERVGGPEMPTPSYSQFFEVIEGFEEFHAGTTDSISGIETPDEHTLVIHLTEPSGDLPYRFTLPGTSPVPEGADDGHDTDYVRFLVATGPYMIEGSEDLDFSLPPDEQTPVSGFVPKDHMTLVRNPSWDPAQDPLRPAYVDRIELELVPHADLFDPEVALEVADRIDDGSLDLSGLAPTKAQIERYLGDPLLRERVIEVPGNAIYYMPMNLALPPFDDVHVRRAVVLAIDRTEIAEHFTESEQDEVYRPISHALVPSVEGGLLPDGWRPAWASGVSDAGSFEAARAEMALSRYDLDGDGVCDHLACRGIATLVETKGMEYGYRWWWTQVRDDMAAIGMELKPRVLPCWNPEDKLDVLDAMNRPDTRYGLALGVCYAWAPDFPDGSTFIPLLDSSGLDDRYNGNYALLGATSEQLRSWGYEVTEVPSVDDRIDACMALTGNEHTQCWAQADQYLSQEVVPWVPMFTAWRRFVLGERIDHVSVIVQNARPALDQISLAPGSE